MRSDDELRDLSERVLYSIEMLFASATTLLRNGNGDLLPPLSTTAQNAELESFVLHFRALHEFLWKPRNKRYVRDGRAEDFFDPGFWAASRPCEEITVLAGPARVGREVAHITYGVGADTPEWMVAQIAASIGRCFRVFLAWVDRSRVVPDFEDRVRVCWPHFLNFHIAVSYPADNDPPGIATNRVIPPPSPVARWGPLDG